MAGGTSIENLSIFGDYGAEENRLTVALLQVLKVGGEQLIRYFAEMVGFPLPSSDVEITTQIREAGCVPDGLLRSRFSFSLYIESKTKPNAINEKQRDALCNLAGDGVTVVYLTPDSERPRALDGRAVEWASWLAVRDCLDSYLQTREAEGQELLEFLIRQFDTFASNIGVLGSDWTQGTDRVLIIAAGATGHSILAHGVYICQNRRSFRPSGWLALYRHRQIEDVLPILEPPQQDVILVEHKELEKVIATGEHSNADVEPRQVFRLGELERVGPIRDDSVDKNGRPCPFTYGQPRYTSIDRLRSSKVTSEL